MKCSNCSKQDHTVFHSSVYDKLVCTQCYEELSDVSKKKTLNFILQILIGILIILAVCAILFVNQSLAQTSDQDFVSANLRDSIGTLFCCDGSRLPCTPTYTLETRIVGWKLIPQEYLVIDTYTERAWSFYLHWQPVYESVWREIK